MEGRCWCGGPLLKYDTSTYSPGGIALGCADSRYHDPLATGRILIEDVRILYVAGPMSGKANCNYPAFDAAASALRDAGFEVVNPVEVSATLEQCHYTDYLRSDLRALLDCQGIALLPEWEFSTGARNEVNVAGLLGMPVLNLEDWLSRGCRAR